MTTNPRGLLCDQSWLLAAPVLAPRRNDNARFPLMCGAPAQPLLRMRCGLPAPHARPVTKPKSCFFKPLTSQPWRPIDRTEGCTMPAPLLASCAPTHLARKAVTHHIWHDSLLTTHMHLCCPRSCAIAATPTPMLTRCAAGTCSSSRSPARGGSGRTLSVRSRGAPLGTCTLRSCPRPPNRRRWPPRGEDPSRGAPKFC